MNLTGLKPKCQHSCILLQTLRESFCLLLSRRLVLLGTVLFHCQLPPYSPFCLLTFHLQNFTLIFLQIFFLFTKFLSHICVCFLLSFKHVCSEFIDFHALFHVDEHSLVILLNSLSRTSPNLLPLESIFVKLVSGRKTSRT